MITIPSKDWPRDTPEVIARNRNWAERSLDLLRNRVKGRTHPVMARAEERKTKFSLTNSHPTIRARGTRMREGKAAKRKIDSSGWSIQV